MKKEALIEGKWNLSHIALFGAILLSHGIAGKEKENLKKWMHEALCGRTLLGRHALKNSNEEVK